MRFPTIHPSTRTTESTAGEKWSARRPARTESSGQWLASFPGIAYTRATGTLAAGRSARRRTKRTPTAFRMTIMHFDLFVEGNRCSWGLRKNLSTRPRVLPQATWTMLTLAPMDSDVYKNINHMSCGGHKGMYARQKDMGHSKFEEPERSGRSYSSERHDEL